MKKPRVICPDLLPEMATMGLPGRAPKYEISFCLPVLFELCCRRGQYLA